MDLRFGRSYSAAAGTARSIEILAVLGPSDVVMAKGGLALKSLIANQAGG
jgi:hypothetical protein